MKKIIEGTQYDLSNINVLASLLTGRKPLSEEDKKNVWKRLLRLLTQCQPLLKKPKKQDFSDNGEYKKVKAEYDYKIMINGAEFFACLFRLAGLDTDALESEIRKAKRAHNRKKKLQAEKEASKKNNA